MIFLVKNNFEAHVKKFLKYLSRNDYSDETITGYSKDLNKFYQYLVENYGAQVTVLDFTKEDILDYQDSLLRKGLAKNSIARHISTIKSFSKYLFNELDFGNDPGNKVKTPTYTLLIRVITEEQMQQFLDVAKQYSSFYYTLAAFLYYTGSRITPVIILINDHVSLEDIKVYFPKIKGVKDFYLPLHDQLVDIASAYVESNPKTSTYAFPSPKFLNKHISTSYVRYHLKKYKI